MSVIRAALTVVEAVAYQMALTPPNPTPKKGRYHTEAPYILQIAPLIFWVSRTPSSEVRPAESHVDSRHRYTKSYSGSSRFLKHCYT